MPRKVFNSDSEDDKFETEAFQFMNDKNKVDRSKRGDSDDGQSESGSEDNDDRTAAAQDEDSDDEAPESVGFSDSRNNILAQLKSAMMQVDKEKQKRKEKRKQQETLYKDQKEKKMKYIKETKLPDDILDSIEEDIPQTTKHRKKIQNEKQTKPEIIKDNARSNTEVKGHPAGDQYIPLVDEASGVEVTEVHRYEKQHKSLAQKAADFRNSRLNGKDIPRESNKVRLLKSEKKKQRLKKL